MGSVIVAGLWLALLVVTIVHRRRERVEWGRLADAQRAGFGQVIEELTSLRSALVAAGAAERLPRLPPAPPPASDGPPSTKPAASRKVPASPRSAPRPVSLEDQITRAMRRLERQAKVPPEVEARWEERLRALGAALGLVPDTEPTDAQVEAMIRELYEAEADVKDARPGAPPLEATLPSAVSPIAVRCEGDRPAALPQANAGDDPRPPHRPPRPAGDPLAGVKPERPKSSATRTAESFQLRQTLFNGLATLRGNDQDEGGRR